MTASHRRSVTRGYVAGLVFAVVIIALALLLIAWSGISLLSGGDLVSTPGSGVLIAPLTVVLLLALLGWSLWTQALVLLRGKRGPSWEHVLLVSVGAYLLWCMVGLVAGLSVEDTWVSPYAAALAVVWALSSLLYWALLARRVYTDRPAPQWPWERRGELGPDWANTDETPWDEPNGARRDDFDDDPSDDPQGGAR